MKKKSLEQQEKQYDERRKRLRRLLGLILFITLTVIGMGLWASLRRRTTVVNAPVTLPKNVNRRLSGYTFTRSEEGRQIFTLHAARTLDYGKGSNMVLEDVHVVIFGRAGNRHDEVTTDRCQYDNETNALACSGKASVKLEAEAGMQVKPSLRDPQPLFLETSDISFDPSHSAVTTPRAVRFQFGSATGAAQGLVYNTRTEGLTLQKNVTLRLPVESTSTIEAFAGSLIYAKQSNEISLGAPIHIVQGGRQLSASAGNLFLDAANRVTRVALSGVQGSDALPAREIKGSGDSLEADFDPRTSGVRALLATGHVVIEGREESKEGGSIRRLTAEKVSLDLAGAKSDPRSGNAQGNVELVFRPAGGSAVSRHANSSRRSSLAMGPAAGERILNAPELQFTFQSHSLLREAQTDGPSKLQLIPTDPSRDRQTVTAGSFQMAFDLAGRLETIHGSPSTRIVDQPPLDAKRSTLPLVSTADELLAKVDPATGAIKTLQQKGNFHFQQGASQAHAAEAQFEAQKQTLALSGSPELWDTDGRIQAGHIVVGLADGVAEGRGNVRSIHFSLPPGSGSPAGTTADSSPIIVLADRVTAYRERQVAHYEGNVRASHGADVVQSSSLDVYRKQQQLTSGKGVVTSLVEPALSDASEDGGSGKHKSETGAVQPVTITADRLQYFNLGREAVYQGNVRMVSTDTTFTANRLQIYFSQPGGAKGSEIERAVADGHVRVTQAPGRRALGEHAEYFAAAGKVVLTGGPPVVYDAQQGYLTGQRLTFFTRDASLFAGGGNKSRTLSKRRILQQ